MRKTLGLYPMAILTFKFDESYKSGRSLILAGWIADDRQWKRLEQRRQKAIASENKSLPAGAKIRRYHAACMNASDGEFKDWDARRKLRFSRKLLKFLSNGQMAAIGCGIDLQAFSELFPNRIPKDFCIANLFCMQMLMVLIGEAVERQCPPEQRVSFVHDHGDWDAEALKGYNRMMEDSKFEYAHRFVGISSRSWTEKGRFQNEYQLGKAVGNN